MIYSAKADNYSKPYKIVDLVTGKVYTEKAAHQASKEIKSRLVIQREKGTWVHTIKELDEIKKLKH